MTTKSSKSIPVKYVYELLAVLSLQFILGVALTTVISFEPDSGSMAQKIVLYAHMFLGGYLCIIALLQVIRSYKNKLLQVESWIGLAAILAAFGFGSVAAQNDSEWATFAMSLGFIVALVAYGKCLITQQK